MPAASKLGLPTGAERAVLVALALLATLRVGNATAGEAGDRARSPSTSQPAAIADGEARRHDDGFDFLHVVANEGGSSGGHAAIRFGRYTFHFQRTDDRLLHAVRDDSDRFIYEYAYLQNRDIHVQHVVTDPATRQALLDSFNERARLQAERVDVAARLHGDVALFESLAGDEPGPDGSDAVGIEGLAIEGAGYFFERVDARPTPLAAGSHPSRAVSDLRARVAERYGSVYLADRTRDLRDRLEVARLAEREDSLAIDFASDVVGPDTVARGVVDALAELAALRVIAADVPLREPAYAAPAQAAFRLSPAESDGLGDYAVRLRADLVDLLGSQRSDRGYALLVGLARLLAIERSLASGSLVFLDTYPDDATVLDRELVVSRLSRHPELLEDAAAELEAAMKRLAERGAVDERDYVAVEAAANRALELQRAAVGGDLRIAVDRMLPRRGAAIGLRRGGTVGTEALRIALAQARARAAAYDEALRAEYGYHLLRRNCVTEIFRTIDAAWPDASVRESTMRLGGYVDPDAGLHFVPFAAAAAVGRTYAVPERRTIPSYRTLRLARMMRAQSPAVVYLREFNTLTSSVYEREPDQSLFAIYSDSPVLLRPLFGGINLATGLVQTALGLVRAPLDGPTGLLAGLRGVAFSLPELAFVRLRRGTRAYVDAGEVADLVEDPPASRRRERASARPSRAANRCHAQS